MIWNKAAECMSDDDKSELQLKLLQNSIKNVYENVPFYKELFDDANLKPEDIKTLKDIEKIPFTTKTDLRAAYPFKMEAVPEEEIVETHSSSGTTGVPTVSEYTKKDIDTWGEIVARGLGMCNATRKTRIQNAYGYGLFTGGFGIHHGSNTLGCIVIPISAGNTKRQIDTIMDFKSNILTCTPSYAAYIGESLKKAGYKPEDNNLEYGIFGAEMWTEELRSKIEESLGITALNIYGLTEVMGPGIAIECEEKNGLHLADDHFYPEVINPKTGEVLPEGETGELVLTTLTREGTPVIRFRTKDITAIHKEKCACGRTSWRIERITGRSDDMLKIRGVMIFPYQIERALFKNKEIQPTYQIHVTRPELLDEVEVKVEVESEMFSDEMKELTTIERKLAKDIKDEIGLRVNVTLVEPDTLPRSEGKAIRVIDERDFS